MLYLRCDEPHCDHAEPHEGEFTKKTVGKPCPKCGASLLTEEDYRLWKKIRWIYRIFKFFGLAKDSMPGEQPAPGYKKINVHGHNNTITLKEYDG